MFDHVRVPEARDWSRGSWVVELRSIKGCALRVDEIAYLGGGPSWLFGPGQDGDRVIGGWWMRRSKKPVKSPPSVYQDRPSMLSTTLSPKAIWDMSAQDHPHRSPNVLLIVT